MLATHLTPLYSAALHDPLLHELEHAAYLGGALLFWAPLVGADPLPRRLGAAGRLAWLLAAMPPMGLLGAWLLTGPQRYAEYGIAGQRDAAALMWVAGSVVLAAATVVLAGAALVREERRQRRREAVADRHASAAPAEPLRVPLREAR
jgi:cytochrome c oxidase assembly factor CtaG